MVTGSPSNGAHGISEASTRSVFPEELAKRIAALRLVAVVTVEDVATAAPLARALWDGGVRAIELAWRTPDTIEAMVAIRRAAPDIILGVGTLLWADQARRARDAGADFGVSPGLSPTVIRACQEIGLPFAPGVQTPSDLHSAVEHGCRLLKFFPAETAGGIAHLRAINVPFAHLGLRYIALGGVHERNAAAYLAEKSVLALGGSWIAPVAAVRAQEWDSIRQRAAAAIALVSTATPFSAA